jgi:hypothetical protein
MKFIDEIDKSGKCVFVYSLMPIVVIPLNDVFVAYILGYMKN